ncbi:MAG TPA: plastocyanin/azurin family copper-binding protein [Nitrososphaera sp.]|nr:plastocyanin/azurin family copper-binding protein [Nitrososphaera sp.]
MANHAGGISIIAFVVAVAVSMGYYQFFYLPEANAKPILPEKVLNPRDITSIQIVEGAALESNPRNFIPKDVRGILELSNKVVWTNNDGTAHTVTTDDDYVDQINGAFDSTVQLGTLIDPGETFEFTFTKEGEYAYHCTPHPHMKGVVEIVPNFA